MASLSCLVMTAQASQPVRNVVIVHGAFVDGFRCTDVFTLLERGGYHVRAMQNPLTPLCVSSTA